MAENAETVKVEEPEKEQETVNEKAPVQGDDDDCNDDQTLRQLRDTKINQETAKLKVQKTLPVSGFLIKSPIVAGLAKSDQASDSDEKWKAMTETVPPEGQMLLSLLRSLPILTSDSEDAKVVYEILMLVLRISYIRPLFEHKWAINQVLNPTSVQRSCSDLTLQAYMVALVLCISSFDNKEKKILVHDCPGTIPFLTACLGSVIDETRQFAATALSWLSSEESNRKKMGELNTIEPLIIVIRLGDHELCLCRVVRAGINLCKVAENREMAVSEGAVAAVIDKIRRRVCVDRMLRFLEVLSGDEKAIAQVEESGVVKELFVMLGEEGFSKEVKEHCITIIHAACGTSAAKTKELVKGAKNGRKTLDRVVSSGTAKAKEMAKELLQKLDSASS